MPKLGNDYESAAESTATDFKAMEPGVYMCRIQAVRTEWTDSSGKKWRSGDGGEPASEKSYVKLIIDVDEGEHAGRFSDEYWAGEDKDYGHTLYMSWSPNALGMLKHTFSSLDEANPGFDAKAAFEADQWMMFVGKRLLVEWNGQEYESNTGDTRLRVRPNRALVAADKPRTKVELLDGEKVDYSEWKDGGANQGYHAQGSSTPSDGGSPYDADVPF